MTNPVLTVEFKARAADAEFMEESVTLHGPDELLAFVSPGGGCESIPAEVGEIRMMFLDPRHANVRNPLADKRVTLQIGMVVFTGPLSMIVQTAEQIIDRAGRGELSPSFVSVLGVSI